MQTVLIPNRSLFVFVVLIAAQSTGNVCAKVFQNVLQKECSCGYQHLAGTMEDMSDYTTCVHVLKGCMCVDLCVWL